MVAKRKELSIATKEAIVSLYYSGVRQSEISRRLDIPKTTISGVINRFRSRESVENRQRSGAPPKLSSRDTRGLLRVVKQNR
jgi:transposase